MTVGQNFLILILELGRCIVVGSMHFVLNNYVAQIQEILRNYTAYYHKGDHTRINMCTF